MTKRDLSKECKVGSIKRIINVIHSLNKIKNKNYRIISIDEEKALDKL